MLRVIQAGLARPVSYPVDPNATFEPGVIGQLKIIGNDVVMGVSDGRAPFGILDDIKSVSFTAAVIDEIVDIEVPVEYDGYNWVSTMVGIAELANAGIVQSSFVADYEGLILNANNGTLRAPIGSIANFSTVGGITPNAIRTIVRYAFRIPGIAGDDTTQGSGKVTIWFQRFIGQTDQYETDAVYAVNAALFVSTAGKLTTVQSRSDVPGVAMCLIPPMGHNSVLEFLWL